MKKRTIMSTRHRTAALAALGALVLACAGPAALHAAEPAMDLKWDQLVPPAAPKQLRSFLPRPGDRLGLGGAHEGGPPPANIPEGRWMSSPQPSTGQPAPVVESLAGKRVRIGGYVVPLDFEATRVKEFLLVPFVGACIHVPPPPANQIVYVKAEKGFDVQGMFDPVWVTGTLAVTPAFTGLAEAGYTLDAEKVELRPKG
jgi:hypothetical protein